MEDESSFSNLDISNTPQKENKQYSKSELNRIKVHDFIRKKEPTTIYKIHQELKLSYNTVAYIVRDLLFAGIVHGQIVVNENNVATKLLTIPKEKSEVAKND